VLHGRFLGDKEFVEEIKAKAGEEGRFRTKIKPEIFLEVACGHWARKSKR